MKVAIYTRLSDEDRNKVKEGDDSGSIQNQKNMLIKHAAEKGWDVYDTYTDDDYTGADRNRPEFKRLLSDAQAKKFDIILCKTQSRFSREMEIVERYIHGLFLEWGIRFVGLVDNADTSNQGNKKSRQINGLVNEWYLEDLSGNVRSSLDLRRSDGKYIASFPLYGYKKRAEDHNQLEIDEPAAQIVRRIFILYLDGQGIYAIAKKFNLEGIPNPTWYKKQQGLKVMSKKRCAVGSHWSPNTVRSILDNRMYLGEMIQGKQKKVSFKSAKLMRTSKDEWYVVPDNHPAIIDLETWGKVHDRLNTKSKSRKDGTRHVFAGKTFCADCGLALHSNTSKGIKYLRCPTGDVAKAHCKGCRMKLGLLEEKVLGEINNLLDQFYDEDAILSNIDLKDTHQADLQKAQDELDELTAKAEAQKKVRMSLYLDKVKGIISEDEFIEMSKTVANDSLVIETNRKAAEAKIAALEEKSRNKKSRRDILSQYRHLDQLTHQLVDDLIERIIIGKRDQAGTIPITIYWKI